MSEAEGKIIHFRKTGAVSTGEIDGELLIQALMIVDGAIDIEPSFGHLVALRQALGNANDIIDDMKSEGCQNCGCIDSEPHEFYNEILQCVFLVRRCAHCKTIEESTETPAS